jgi:hypothetical protein
MKDFISKNALKIFIGGLFVVAIAITILLNNYADQMQHSLSDKYAKPVQNGIVVDREASDTLRNNYSMREDSLAD